MKQDFIILDELTLDYGGTNQLWLMLIKCDGKFGIEINSRSERVARRMAAHRKEADMMFMRLEKKLAVIPNVTDAIELLKLAFALRTVREAMFIISTRNMRFTFTDIFRLKQQFSFFTVPHYEDLLNLETDYYEVKVYFPGNPLHLAKFAGPNLEQLDVELNSDQFQAV